MKLGHSKNKHFGSAFRSENISLYLNCGIFNKRHNPTKLSFTLMKYADLYTSRLENFLFYPGDACFIPQVNGMVLVSRKFTFLMRHMIQMFVQCFMIFYH